MKARVALGKICAGCDQCKPLQLGISYPGFKSTEELLFDCCYNCCAMGVICVDERGCLWVTVSRRWVDEDTRYRCAIQVCLCDGQEGHLLLHIAGKGCEQRRLGLDSQGVVKNKASETWYAYQFNALRTSR